MRGSLRIGSIGGIPIRVHWSFAFLLALIVLVYGGAGTSTLLWGIAWLVGLFASVVIHELAHSFVARARGFTVRDIVLLPIGGVSEIADFPTEPADELRISVVGPLMSIALAVVLGVIGLLSGAAMWPPTLTTGSFIVRLMWVNLLLAAFNFLPALPLDGGRVFRAALSLRRGEPDATQIAVRVGQIFGIAMVVVGIAFDFWLAIIGIFVAFGAQAEGRMALLRSAVGGLRVADVMIQDPTTLPADLTAGEVLDRYRPHLSQTFPVTSERGYIGMVSVTRLAGVPPQTRIGEVTDRHAPLLDPAASLYPAAFEAFSGPVGPKLAVGTEGRVVGVLYRDDAEALLENAARNMQRRR